MGVFPAACLLLTLGAGPDPGGPAGPGRPRPGGHLDAEDARYLDWLVETWLFDPRGAIPVRVERPVRGPVPVPEARTEHRIGWLVRGTGGRPDRIHFADGESSPVPAKGVREIDFEAVCDRAYSPNRWRSRLVPDPAEYIPLSLYGGAGGEALADAASLHARGYHALAARALAEARAVTDDPHHELRQKLATRAAWAVCDAFVRRADAEAAVHGERLLRFYPELVPTPTANVLADLDRRRRAGTFDKPPPSWPAGFATWDDRKKAAYLIETLDQIGPAGARFKLDDHPRYQMLVELGDAAVPGLLDAMERDDRLTRFVDPRMFRRERWPHEIDEPMPVGEVAARAVRDILGVNYLEPFAPDESSDRTETAFLTLARRYWSTYGHLPFADRMRMILTNPAARLEARAEAAENLARRTAAERTSWGRQPVPGRPAPLFSRSGLVDDMLAALDDERAQVGRRRRPSRVERVLLRALVELGDPRAGPQLAHRADEETLLRTRVLYTLEAHRLGASGPLVVLARELTASNLALGPRRGRGRPERGVPDTLAEVLNALRQSGLPEADAALDAVADPAHPCFPVVLHDLLTTADPDEFAWSAHPFRLGVLRNALGDPRPTGTHFYLRGDEVETITGAKVSRRKLPTGASGWREHVEERTADRAAHRLSTIAAGLPEPHPLRPDADRVLTEMRTAILRYRWRPLNQPERVRLGLVYFDTLYAPDLWPLGRPATATDVRAGRAVFELDGKGQVAAGKWPAWIQLKGNPADDPTWGLTVQSEVGPEGKVVYGAIFRHAIRAVRADEVERVEPYESPERTPGPGRSDR